MNAIVNFFRNLFGLGSPPRPDPADPCNALACVNAKKRLNDARSKFNGTCDVLRMVRAIARALQQILSTPIWILIALAVIAVLVGGPIAVILLALIAVYAISWVLLPVVAQIGAALGVTLGKRQIEFTDARTDVLSQCPESCRGDLSVPQCQLE
jgi:hypothetical protein